MEELYEEVVSGLRIWFFGWVDIRGRDLVDMVLLQEPRRVSRGVV